MSDAASDKNSAAAAAADAPPLYLVDGSAMAHRAYHGFKNCEETLATATGEDTTAIVGFLNLFLQLLQRERPAQLAVCFDAKGCRASRQAQVDEARAAAPVALADWPDYKAHRKPSDPALMASMPTLERFVAAMGCACLRVGGVEADDTIGTLATRAAAGGGEAVIVGVDKDFNQLISPRVSILCPRGGGEYEERGTAWFDGKFEGITPELFPDFLALVGDSVDGIPGIRGVGPKRALLLMRDHGGVDSIIAAVAAGEVGRKGKWLEALSADSAPDMMRLGRRLAQLDNDVETPPLSALQLVQPRRAVLHELVARFELASLGDRLLAYEYDADM